MKWLKYHTSYIFAYSMAQDELPPAPAPFEEGERPGGIVGGDLGRALQTVMRRGRSGNWPARRCAYDILMSKLGDPTAPPDFIEATFKDHMKALSKTQESPNFGDRVVLNLVKRAIDEICEQMFRGKEFSHRDPLPSLRACFENKLSEAGAFGELLKGFEYQSVPLSTDLFGMVEVNWEVIEVRFISGDDVVEDFQDYVDYLWRSRLKDPLDAIPVPILEPLKVRMITKGQAAEYYRTIELQKFMHGTLKRHPVFEYIGHPIDDQSWANAFGTKRDLLDSQFFVSGDYRAATDNLCPELSLYAWDRICSVVSFRQSESRVWLSQTEYADLGRKALCGHRLHYPDGTVIKQTWGQLMGSPMSFPILCIVNAAATLCSQGWKFDLNLPLKVNGDDVAFISDEPHYRQWKSTTRVCGLEFSIGKNYTSRDFIIMNSELRRPMEGGRSAYYRRSGFQGEPDSKDDPWAERLQWYDTPKAWKLEGFLNQSILYHRVKKGVDAGQMKDVYWTDLESLSHEAIRGIPDHDQWKVLSIFLESHRSVLQEVPPLCNIWFPKALGGAGVPIPSGKTLDELCSTRDPSLLEKQQKVASYLACDPKQRLKRISRSRPIVGRIGEVLRDILGMSDAQVKPVLRNKPLRREQKTMIGGKTLLGYLLRSLGGEGSLGGELRKESTAEDQTMRMHRKEAAYLVQKYFNWTRKALRTSLAPMKLSSISGYQEHLEMFSYIELLSESPTSRSMDVERATEEYVDDPPIDYLIEFPNYDVFMQADEMHGFRP